MLRSKIFRQWTVGLMLLFSIWNFIPSPMKVTMDYSAELSAQLKGHRYVNQGRVVNRYTNRPIPNARVYVLHDRMYGSHDETFTDAHGNFTVTLRLNNEIKISADGYIPYEVSIIDCR